MYRVVPYRTTTWTIVGIPAASNKTKNSPTPAGYYLSRFPLTESHKPRQFHRHYGGQLELLNRHNRGTPTGQNSMFFGRRLYDSTDKYALKTMTSVNRLNACASTPPLDQPFLTKLARTETKSVQQARVS